MRLSNPLTEIIDPEIASQQPLAMTKRSCHRAMSRMTFPESPLIIGALHKVPIVFIGTLDYQ